MSRNESIKTNKLRANFAAMLMLASPLGLWTFTGAAAAQDQERVFQPGELVKTGGGQVWKILQCRPEKVTRNMECEFVSWKNGGAISNKLWMMASQIAAAEARVKQAEELEAMTESPDDAQIEDVSEMPLESDPGASL